MARTQTWFWIASFALAAAVCPRLAHADYFSSWIAATCDPGSGMAAIRFGYADAEDAPLFIHADSVVSHGLTAMPVSNASQKEASCSFGGRREVKVQLGTGYGEPGNQYSIWIDKIRVLHGYIDTYGPKFVIPFAVIIYPNGFRTCDFRLPSNGLYDVTTAGLASLPPNSIHCNSTLSAVRGPRDLIEYPLSPTAKPVAGSIIVSGPGAQLCRRMVVRVKDVVPGTLEFGSYKDPDADAIVVKNLGSALPIYAGKILGRPSGSGDPLAFVATKTLDFFGVGHAVQIYMFSSGGSYPSEFLAVPPKAVGGSAVMAMTSGVQFEHWADRLERLGWNVFSGAQIPFNPMAESSGLQFDLIVAQHGAYLLWYPSRPWYPSQGGKYLMASLVKPLSAGGAAPVCLFDRVAPHF